MESDFLALIWRGTKPFSVTGHLIQSKSPHFEQEGAKESDYGRLRRRRKEKIITKKVQKFGAHSDASEILEELRKQKSIRKG